MTTGERNETEKLVIVTVIYILAVNQNFHWSYLGLKPKMIELFGESDPGSILK